MKWERGHFSFQWTLQIASPSSSFFRENPHCSGSAKSIKTGAKRSPRAANPFFVQVQCRGVAVNVLWPSEIHLTRVRHFWSNLRGGWDTSGDGRGQPKARTPGGRIPVGQDDIIISSFTECGHREAVEIFALKIGRGATYTYTYIAQPITMYI